MADADTSNTAPSGTGRLVRTGFRALQAMVLLVAGPYIVTLGVTRAEPHITMAGGVLTAYGAVVGWFVFRALKQR